MCFSAGGRNQPLVQLQRKSLQLPSDSNYTALSATLTTARTQYEIGGFPFLLGQETNSSGRRIISLVSLNCLPFTWNMFYGELVFFSIFLIFGPQKTCTVMFFLHTSLQIKEELKLILLNVSLQVQKLDGQTWRLWPWSAFTSLTKMAVRSRSQIRSTSRCRCRPTPATGWPPACLLGCISLRQVMEAHKLYCPVFRFTFFLVNDDNGDDYLHSCRIVGSERDGLHQKGRPTVCVERGGSSDGILVSRLPFIFRYCNPSTASSLLFVLLSSLV